MKTKQNKVKEIEYIFFADEIKQGGECKVCGISSINHVHFKGDKPKDYETLPPNVMHLKAPTDEKKCQCEKPHKDKEKFICEKHGFMHQLGDSNSTDEIVGEKWSKEFDEIFSLESDGLWLITPHVKGVWGGSPNKTGNLEDIKSFIRQTLSTSQQSLVERILKELPNQVVGGNDYSGHYANGYNWALDEVKEILRKMR